MAGVTTTGFVGKRLPEVLDDNRSLATLTFQDLVLPGDNVDVSDSSAVGRLVALASPGEADLWEAAQEVYSAFDANSATGISLDNMILLSGIPARFENTYTTAQVLLDAETGTILPARVVVSSDSTGQRFDLVNETIFNLQSVSGLLVGVITPTFGATYTITYTRQALTFTITYTSSGLDTNTQIVTGLKAAIDALYPDLIATLEGNLLRINLADVFNPITVSVTDNLGVIEVLKLGDVVAESFGPVAQPYNSITTITTPRLGWKSVYNPIAAVPGRLRETDEELRIRFRNTKFERATSTIEAIYSALFSLDDVQQVFIEENDTNTINADGVLPHSFLTIVDGGVSVDIARAIWENRPGGILSQGNTTVPIIDSRGTTRYVSFSRPTLDIIYITLDITPDENFPENGQDLMKQAIIAYIDSLSIGQDVVYSRLYTPINSIPGHQVNSLLIGTDPDNLGTSNIIIPFDAISQITPDHIIFV